MGQEIYRNTLREEDVIEYIDFDREYWPDSMDPWLDRRYRVMPLDGYDTEYPTINRAKININTTNLVIHRG